MIISSAYAQDTSTMVASVGGELVPAEISQEKMFTDTLVFLFLLFVIFYFVLIRPQQKKFKAHQALTDGLKKGDKIITSGGVIGTIHKFDGDHVAVIEVAEKTYLSVARGSISDLYKEPAPKAPAAKDVKPPKAANDK